MEALPYEILAAIFSLVIERSAYSILGEERLRDWISCRLVCKNWNKIAGDPTLVPPPEPIPHLVYSAKLAEQAEDYTDMVAFMKKRADFSRPFEVEERNLFSVAYKNVIGQRRASWRISSSVEQKEELKAVSMNLLNIVKDYVKRIEREIIDICDDCITVVETILARNKENTEGTIFFVKMRADYYRYKAEILHFEERKAATEEARNSYLKATALAESSLRASHPIRLGIALNFSVFYYEIANEPDNACQVMKSAFDAAIGEIDTLSEEEYKDATMIMQLLRDSVTLWTPDMEEEPEDTNDQQN